MSNLNGLISTRNSYYCGNFPIKYGSSFRSLDGSNCNPIIIVFDIWINRIRILSISLGFITTFYRPDQTSFISAKLLAISLSFRSKCKGGCTATSSFGTSFFITFSYSFPNKLLNLPIKLICLTPFLFNLASILPFLLSY